MTTSSPALNIDIMHLITSRANIQFSGRPTNSKDGREYHSSCPWCNGTDRFSIWPEVGRWSCKVRSSGCGRWGDGIGFLMQWENLTYHMACKELDLDPRYPEEARALPLFMLKDEEPNQKWQSAAEAFCWRAERYLWSSGGKKALEYLQSRGLSLETIKQARIGYCPGWFSESLESWGLLSIQTDEGEIKIPAGIVFSYRIEKKIWKIQVKRFEDPEKGYFQVVGSSDCPFGIDSLEPGKPVMLTEGEIDALSAIQETGDLVTPIATGGTNRGQSTRWISKLKQAPIVLIGFDQDENRAGDEGSTFWLKKLPNAVRWTPWAHDVNDLLFQSPALLRTWVELGLRSAQARIAPVPIVQSPVLPLPVEQPLSALHPQTSPALYIPHKIRNPNVKRNQAGDLFLCTSCVKEQAVRWEYNSEYERAWCKRCLASLSNSTEKLL